jgi:hypothetical protein
MLGFNPLAATPLADSSVSATVSVSGVQATGQLGTAAVEADANVNVTGVQGTTALGETTETADANVYAIGVQGTGQSRNM